MKHLLILISILLLSSPVIGDNHKGETLYGWGNTLPYVWKGVGDKETQPKYQGQVKDGKPNGLGIFIDRFGTKRIGNWKDGEMNGQGTETLPDGQKYKGKWKNGEYHGQGTLTLLNGDKYEGKFKDGENWNGTGYNKDGEIVIKFVNGQMIEQ